MSRPKVGFLGVGWIGRQRMEAMIAGGAIEAAAIADSSAEMVAQARAVAPDAVAVGSLEEMLALDLDGIAIATPSALHAEQAIQALAAGAAVFCQKPLGRRAAEVVEVVDAARRADRLLAVDLSYRFTDGMRRIADLIRAGELGRVFAADLVFHNAYGPDKPWFYDRAQSGGGCVVDLGVHLVDLGLWALGFPELRDVSSALLASGQRFTPASGGVEDYAVATLSTAEGAVIRIACSWRLQAGRDAEIAAAFYGTAGGAALRNRDGSFTDFIAERFSGTSAETLSLPPDDWGGRAAADWAARLVEGGRFDPAAHELVAVAEVLDRIYAGADAIG